ncbi:hypothetical protein C8R43DRAFT_316112 [Mycena crocata]|nr:hypothetical protein C8R43DRAFT_316112 [Mycena crocata]
MEYGLPPELERHVFEATARSRPVIIPKLMLVAWRVKEWVEPFLYHTIAITSIRGMECYPCFSTEVILHKPAPFLRKHVRNLFVNDEFDEETLKALLPICTGIENLWTCCDWEKLIALDREQLISLVAGISLKHLYADVGQILRYIPPTHPFFSQITHLEVIGLPAQPQSPTDMGVSAGLSLIPRLTHLSFNDLEFVPICLPLLRSCNSLSVLIALDLAEHPQTTERIDAVGLSEDLRFVVMNCWYFRKDWQMGRHAGVAYWTRAEDFIAQRRSGTIDGASTRPFLHMPSSVG